MKARIGIIILVSLFGYNLFQGHLIRNYERIVDEQNSAIDGLLDLVNKLHPNKGVNKKDSNKNNSKKNNNYFKKTNKSKYA